MRDFFDISDINGDAAWIDVDKIVAIEPADLDCCTVHLSSGHSLMAGLTAREMWEIVRETPS